MRSAPAHEGTAAAGPERSPRRDVAHLFLLIVPWTLVGWLWWRVAQTTTTHDVLWAVGLVGVIAAASLPVNLAWILYNVRIFRRKGPRTGRPSSHFDYATDWTGRPVQADWPAVRAASVVIVQPTAERKTFAPSGGVEP